MQSGRFLSVLHLVTKIHQQLGREEIVYFLRYLFGPYIKYPSHIRTPYD